MPVMDGFEMVKRFRIFEKEQHMIEINCELKEMAGNSGEGEEDVETGLRRSDLLNSKQKLFIIGMSANSIYT